MPALHIDKIPEDVIGKLDDYAELVGMSRSAFIRRVFALLDMKILKTIFKVVG